MKKLLDKKLTKINKKLINYILRLYKKKNNLITKKL